MEQTNRTILFEEINPQLNSILAYINSDNSESLSDDVLRIIQNNLEMCSFDEFLDKMKPSIYLCMNVNTKSVYCTLDASNEGKQVIDSYEEVHKIALERENLLLKYYLRRISENTDICKKINMKEQFTDLIYPIENKDMIRKTHTDIMLLLAENKEREAVSGLYRFCENYNNSLILLPIIIEYIEDELKRLRMCDDIERVLIQDCKGTQIEICNVSENFQRKNISLNAYTALTYEKILQEHLHGVKNLELLKDFFMIAIYAYKKDEEFLQNLYTQYCKYYREVIEIFWSKCRPLLEKVLGVYTFFAQYSSVDRGMSPKLLITNVLVQDIVNAKNKTKIDLYLKSTNEKNTFENTIWYAIVPRMEYKNEEYQENVRVRFQGNDKKISTEVTSISEFHVLMDMLARYKIQTFISPVNMQNTTAEWVLKKGIYSWIDYQQKIIQRENAEYVYPSFPNFSVTKDSYLQVKIGGEGIENENRNLWIQMLGIEAAYVAAGMFAAMQCPNFLRQYFRNKITIDYPGVGFRILENNSNLNIPSTLKSGIFRFSQEVLDEIEKKCYGIFFAPYGNRFIVIQDRAMTGNYGVKDNVSIIQTLTYIERKLRYETQDYKLSLIEQFFQRRPNSLLVNWSNNNMYYNSILKPGENIQYTLDKENRECVLEVVFEQQRYQKKIRLNQ